MTARYELINVWEIQTIKG